MNWPDIFFRARPPRRKEKESLPLPAAPPEAGTPEPEVPANPTPTESAHLFPISTVVLPPAPVHPDSSDESVVHDMAEADTLRQLSRSGGVRLIKRDFSSLPMAPAVATKPAAGVGPAEASAPIPAAEVPMPPAPPLANIPAAPEAAREPEKKMSSRLTSNGRTTPAINLTAPRDPALDTVYPAARTIFRRRTKIADVARVVLPPRREESLSTPAPGNPSGAPAPAIPPANAVPASAESAAIVIPPAFPVAMPGRPAPAPEAAATETGPAPEAISQPRSTSDVDLKAPGLWTDLKLTARESGAGAATSSESPLTSAVEQPAVSQQQDASTEQAPAESTPPVGNADRAASESAAETSQLEVREKREFLLANGERILGQILSESPDAIYLNHDTLGVLTIPRAQIAQRLIEIILINGDRVVGDVIAESKDSLFVRHSSLGILTVPRNQRSTRVVEAILKDGDRILGEVLSETETFTVIRSATLGTVTVPHDKVAMLNRRAEEVQMKALAAPSPAIADQPTS